MVAMAAYFQLAKKIFKKKGSNKYIEFLENYIVIHTGIEMLHLSTDKPFYDDLCMDLRECFPHYLCELQVCAENCG